jgi:capsular polysaccharide biosynthesis protein
VESARKWRARAIRMFPETWAPFQFKDAAGRQVDIQPFAAWYKDITVLGGDWVTISEDGGLLVEHMVHTPHMYLGRKRVKVMDQGKLEVQLGEVSYVPDRAFLLGGNGNYYHWLIDYLPRLLLIKDFIPPDAVILVDEAMPGYQLESLARIGIDPSRLMPIPKDGAVQVYELLLSNLMASTTVPHPKVPDLLRSTYAIAFKPTKKGRRIYLSRRDATWRRLVNEEAIERLMREHGFEVLVPGEMSFAEQVSACASADVIVSVHGAALANVVFARPGTLVIEIACSTYKVSSMKLLAKYSGHRYASVGADVALPDVSGNPLLGDWLANEAELKSLLISKQLTV